MGAIFHLSFVNILHKQLQPDSFSSPHQNQDLVQRMDIYPPWVLVIVTFFCFFLLSFCVFFFLLLLCFVKLNFLNFNDNITYICMHIYIMFLSSTNLPKQILQLPPKIRQVYTWFLMLCPPPCHTYLYGLLKIIFLAQNILKFLIRFCDLKNYHATDRNSKISLQYNLPNA